MSRPELTSLVSHVRSLIRDTGTPPVLTDERIEAAIQTYAVHRDYVPLRCNGRILPTGKYSYEKFHSMSGGFWDSDTQLVDGTYQVQTPTTVDLIAGVWTFSPGRSLDDIRVFGYQYDLHGAAADVLTEWLADLKTDFSFTRGNRSFSRGEQRGNLESLIQQYRNRQWITVTELIRRDMD